MGESEQTTSKPFTGPDGQTFESFDACVTTFEDEDGIDDPEAFCGWLQEEGKEALSDPNADEVLAGLEVEFVSAVDEPAQDSEWLIAKNADGPDGNTHRWQSEATLYVRQKDTDDGDVKQVAFAPVLIPKEADKQGDVIPSPAIEDAAHRYLKEYRKVDSDHDLRDGKGEPVESWTLKQDTTFDLPDGSESRTYPEGTWVMGIKFDDDTWERVTSGELNGLSIYGGAKPIDVDALLGTDKGTDTAGTSDGVAREAAAKSDDEPAWKQEDDPCWEGYVMVGTKPDPEGDGEVPRCVPEDEADEADLTGSVDKSDMGTEDDPGGDSTGNGDGESTSKQDLTADQVSAMLSEFRSMVDDGGLSRDATVEDFVRGIIDDGNVDESNITGLSVFLNGNGGGGGDGGDGMGDEEPEADSSDEEMSGDDDSIDLDVDGGEKSDDGDVDKSDDDVEKSTDDGGAFDDAPEWAHALKSEVDDLRNKVENEPTSDRLEGEEAADVSDRIAKDLTGVDDPDVARKAIREQVEKSDTDGVDVDYEGITDGEDATAEASGGDESGDGSLHSSAANTRMVGGND